MVEDIKVKGRIWAWAYFLLLFIASFSDFALWNDGAHYYYKIMDRGPFIDPLWRRYSDLVLQIPVLLGLKLIGPSELTLWIFKATLLLVPPLTVYLAMRKTRSPFLTFVFWALIPASLIFTVSTANISLFSGAVLLSLFLRPQEKGGTAVLAFCHLILFFGHEAGYIVFLLVLGIGAAHFQEEVWGRFKGKQLVLIELFVLAALVLCRREVWIENASYVSGLLKPSVSSLIFPLALTALSLSFFSAHKFLYGLSWQLLFYVISGVYVMGGDDYYFSLSTVRHFAIPAMVLAFLWLRYGPAPRQVSRTFLAQALLLMAVLLGKSVYLWKQVDLSRPGFIGCAPVESDGKWLPPDWTIPYLSVIEQNGLNANYILVSEQIAEKGQCQRLGVHVLVGVGHRYHTLAMTEKIWTSFDFRTLRQLALDLPYEQKGPVLSLPPDSEMVFINKMDWRPGQCLHLDLKGTVTEAVSELLVHFDGKLAAIRPVNEVQREQVPIHRNFKEVLLKVQGFRGGEITLRSVKVGECRPGR